MFLFDEVKKNYYETLGVAKTAGAEEIKRAYFGLVRKYQPDRFPEEFKEIRAAYETLSDRQSRAEYDAIGEIPSAVASLFHEAQRLDRFGRRLKAAELYQIILKSHPELDNVREQYARSLTQDNKTGKAGEIWEELCRRHPKSSHYARQLGRNYLDRGWNKKALAEIQRALAIDRSSIDSWSLRISHSIVTIKNNPSAWDETRNICLEALEAVKDVRTDEWKKIYLYASAFIMGGLENSGSARSHLREIVRLIREGGRDGREEAQDALREIFMFIPAAGLAEFYPEFREMADLLPDMNDREFRGKLGDIKLNFQIEDLLKKNFPEILHDLFIVLTADSEDAEDEIEIASIEYILIRDKRVYDPQLRRLQEEFPELYELHGAFFNEALRTRNPDKMLHQRDKKINRLKRRFGLHTDDPESAPPEPVRRAQPKVGRNDPCPCGSGKKYKRCCGA